MTRDPAGRWGAPRTLVKGGMRGVWSPEGRSVLMAMGVVGAVRTLVVASVAAGGEPRVVLACATRPPTWRRSASTGGPGRPTGGRSTSSAVTHATKRIRYLAPARRGRSAPSRGAVRRPHPTGGTGPPAFGSEAAASTSTSGTSRATSGWRRSRAHDDGHLGPPPVGRLAGRYRIERELGRGGMATIYLAHDLRHDRDVALKVMHPEVAAALGPERFLREIRISARLDHPHILTLIDSGQNDGSAVVRPALRAGRVPAGQAGAREAAVGRGSDPHRDPGRERPRLCPPARHHPPRHQTREHPPARGRGGGGGLRDRPGGARGGRGAADRDRSLARHAALHESRAGDGEPGARSAL